jgi:hypothetical protein
LILEILGVMCHKEKRREEKEDGEGKKEERKATQC